MGWYEALKDAINVAQKADNLGLMRELLDAQRELMDMQAQNNELRAQVAELTKQQQLSQDLYFEKNVYWRRKSDGTPEGPFCPRCQDADRKLIRLTLRSGYHPQCQNCNNFYPAGEDEGPAFA